MGILSKIQSQIKKTFIVIGWISFGASSKILRGFNFTNLVLSNNLRRFHKNKLTLILTNRQFLTKFPITFLNISTHHKSSVTAMKNKTNIVLGGLNLMLKPPLIYPSRCSFHRCYSSMIDLLFNLHSYMTMLS